MKLVTMVASYSASGAGKHRLAYDRQVAQLWSKHGLAARDLSHCQGLLEPVENVAFALTVIRGTLAQPTRRSDSIPMLHSLLLKSNKTALVYGWRTSQQYYNSRSAPDINVISS
jgi:hypothetical protein